VKLSHGNVPRSRGKHEGWLSVGQKRCKIRLPIHAFTAHNRGLGGPFAGPAAVEAVSDVALSPCSRLGCLLSLDGSQIVCHANKWPQAEAGR
jgi:hypothetical protein